MSISAKPLEIPYRDQPDPTGRIERWRRTLSNALIITRREVRDSFRDWRIISPIIILTFFFPFLAQFVASQFAGFVESYGADVIGTRTVPFLLMIVGFFPISISLVIALETFVGEKERLSLEPLLSTPLTNTELYIGKTLAAMLPPLLSSYGGMTVYLLSLVLGQLAWRPPVTLVVQIVVLTTVQALVMITGAVVVSSQTTSTRAANLLASFIIIPMTLLIQGESAIMFLAPDADSPNGIGSLWAIIAGMIVVVILLLRVGNSLFNREELLGRTMDALNLKRTARTLFASIRAVDDRGTPARNLIDWYRHGIPLSVRRLGWAVPVTIAVFLFALVAGYVIGQQPQWQLPLPENQPINSVMGNVGAYTGVYFGGKSATLAIFWQNTRILLGATLLSIFTFGVASLILTPAVYVILGYIFSEVMRAGYNPTFMIPAIFTHGIIEIPMIVLATAAALHLGAVITRPPRGSTVGAAWTTAFGDTIKLGIGVFTPGLLLAAVIEANITPLAIRLVLGG